MTLRSLMSLSLAFTLLACADGGDDGTEPRGDDDDDDTSVTGDDDDSTPSGDDDDDDTSTVTEPTGDTGDTGPTGTTIPPVELSAPEIVYALPNVDNDWDFALGLPGDDELVPFEVTLSEAPAEALVLRIEGTEWARIWHEDVIVAESLPNGSIIDGELPWEGGIVELEVELGIFDVDGTLILEEVDAKGNVLASTETRLRSSPLILNHHLQTSELVVATSVGGAWGNTDFVDGFTDVLGADFETVPGGQVGWDVWMQDEFEFGTAHLPDGSRMDVIIDSIRDRGLDPYAENRFQGEQFALAVFGSGWGNTYDSFGNLEVSPPIDGYPMGRIYYGSAPGFSPNDVVLHDFFEDQGLQAPIQIDTSWLCVGHVDEFMAFVADETAPRGFRLLYTDTNAAWDFLDGLDPDMELPQYSGAANHGIDTVGELVDDVGLRAHNDDLQLDHLDPILAQLTTELNLTPDEIVLFPGIFENVGGCGGVAALIPGMVNLVSTEVAGTQTLFMADPFLREDVSDQASDPLIAHVESLVPAGTDVVFLDDWDTYHLALGEVHCGSNTVRAPLGDWWTTDAGGHL